MPGRWVIDADHPEGHLVEMTAEEETQAAADRQAAETVAAAERTLEENDRLLRDRLEQALTNLETANANWATLTAAQKDAALRLGIRADAALIRLILRKLDTAG